MELLRLNKAQISNVMHCQQNTEEYESQSEENSNANTRINDISEKLCA